MALKTVVTLTDDLDGSPADETVKFALDGITYEIDLAKTNAEKLRKALQPYKAAARKAPSGGSGRGRGSRGSRSSGGDRQRSARIRAWAKQHGLPVSERGRISTHLAEAYDADDPSRITGAKSSSDS
jgi:hypothetical protein